MKFSCKTIAAALAAGTLLGASTGVAATVLYANGFETNTAGWDVFGGGLNATRVATGTGGVPSADGAFHAQNGTASGTAGNWGGYNFGAGNAVPTAFQSYTTSISPTPRRSMSIWTSTVHGATTPASTSVRRSTTPPASSCVISSSMPVSTTLQT